MRKVMPTTAIAIPTMAARTTITTCRYYYGEVYYDGSWLNGPFYYRDYGGRRQFWIHGGWHDGQFRGGHFGPALGRGCYRPARLRRRYAGRGFNRGGNGGQSYGRQRLWPAASSRGSYAAQPYAGGHNWNRGGFGGGSWNRQGFQAAAQASAAPLPGNGGGWRGGFRQNFQAAGGGGGWRGGFRAPGAGPRRRRPSVRPAPQQQGGGGRGGGWHHGH